MASMSSSVATSFIFDTSNRLSVAVAGCGCGNTLGVITTHELDGYATHGAEEQVDTRHVAEQHRDVACHGPGLVLHVAVVVGQERQCGEPLGRDVAQMLGYVEH